MVIRWVFLLAWFFASLGNTLGSGALANDTRVRIASPITGQQFAPGDKVSIVVKVAPSLGATDGSVGLAGLGILKVKNFTGTGFVADYVIPNQYAGPIAISPSVMVGETIVIGPKVSISVRPRTPPKQLSVQTRYHFLSLPQADPTKIYAKGRYSFGVERDLSSSASGTTYTSSNASVVSVDREGICRAIATGLAVITVENGGVRDVVAFVVEDPDHPSPPIDLSDKVTIRRGNLRLESNPRIVRSHYQRVTITNTTTLPLVGPLVLTVTGLPKGIIAYGGDGDGRHRLTLPDQGLGLLPAQSVTIDLGFLNQGNASIEYTTKVYHGRTNK